MFEGLDAIFLARLQFAFTVSFHFIFPSFSIMQPGAVPQSLGRMMQSLANIACLRLFIGHTRPTLTKYA